MNNTETYYKATRFYQEHHPELISDILNHLVASQAAAESIMAVVQA